MRGLRRPKLWPRSFQGGASGLTCPTAVPLTSGVPVAVSNGTHWYSYTASASGIVNVTSSLTGSPTYAVYKNGTCLSLPAASTTTVGSYWINVAATDIIRVSVIGTTSGTLTVTDYSITPAAIYIRSPQFCFTDAAATTPCGVGDAVYTWLDASGNGRHMTQATSGNRPTYRADGVLFDAVDDWMRSASAAFPAPSTLQHAVYVRVKPAGTPVNFGGLCTISGATEASGWEMWSRMTAASDKWGTYDFTGTAYAPSGTTLVSGSTYTLGMNGGVLRTNGANDGTYVSSYAYQPAGWTGTPTAVGTVNIGADANLTSARQANAYIPGIVIFTAPATSGQQSAAESLLGSL